MKRPKVELRNSSFLQYCNSSVVFSQNYVRLSTGEKKERQKEKCDKVSRIVSCFTIFSSCHYIATLTILLHKKFANKGFI